MKVRMVLKKLLSLFLVLFISQQLLAQNKKQKTILLSGLLNKISNKHQIFFTYNTNLLSEKYIQEQGFEGLTLKESLSLLKKLTHFTFDDLGNNYYVIYLKNTDNSIVNEENALVNKDSTINSTSQKAVVVRGIVLSSDNTPLYGATLVEQNLLIGSTSNKDGTFEFKINKENLIKVSYLGHNSKTLKLTPDKFHTITLLAGQELEEVQIVGSRNKNRVANDTPVAIDFIDITNK